MKKFLLSLATVLCAGSFASAAEVTVAIVANKFTEVTANTVANYNSDGFTFTLNKAKATTNNRLSDTNHLRIYKNATFTVAGDNGQQISKITMTADGASYCGFNEASTGTGSWTSTTYTWTGSANSVTFTAGSAQTRIKSVTITYTPAGGVEVEAPAFSVAGGRYLEAQTVELTAATGLTIYYTTDGAAPTDDVTDGSSIKYETPITVDNSMTIKAIAYNADDKKSNIVSEIYTIVKRIEGAEGEGTEANPYNAIAAINEANFGSTAEVYVEGIVSKITELETEKFGNATYYISADGTETNQFNIFRGYNFGGEKFTSADQLAVGDRVVVKGNLMLYNGVEPEMAQGNQLVMRNGQTTGVEGIEIDANAPVEYYNLQGVRVDNPTKGLYIMRQGDKVVKVVK